MLTADVIGDPLRVGDIRDATLIYAIKTGTAGTVQFVSSPQYSWINALTGQVLIANTNVTSYDVAAAASIQAIVRVNTNTFNGNSGPLTTGVYILQVTAVLTYSDVTIPNETYIRTVSFQVNEYLSGSTYDPVNDLISQVRFHVADTNLTNPVWTDPELQYCLNISDNVPELAAAVALESGASDAAKLAIRSTTDSTTTDLTQLGDKMRDQAQHLRDICATSPSVIGPDLTVPPVGVFIMASGPDSPGTMAIW